MKRIIAHVFGFRSKKALCKLLKLRSSFDVAFWCTDGDKAYSDEKHIVGKLYTQRIERENLTLRNRLKRLNRKTLGVLEIFRNARQDHRHFHRTRVLCLIRYQPIEYITVKFDKQERKNERK